MVQLQSLSCVEPELLDEPVGQAAHVLPLWYLFAGHTQAVFAALKVARSMVQLQALSCVEPALLDEPVGHCLQVAPSRYEP